MLAVQIIIAVVLALFGAGLGLFVLDALRIVRRIRRDKTSRVSELAPGPAEVVGELRATEPVIALDGSLAVAVRRTVHYAVKRDENGYQTAPVTHTEGSLVELSDESGTCLIEMNETLILGHKKHYVLKAEHVRERHPKLWSKVVRLDEGETVEDVIAAEIAVPDGARGFVSGEAALIEGGGKRRFKLHGAPGRPLIVSGWSEKAVIGALLRPTIRVAWLALLCWVVAALAIGIPIVLTARAGLW